MAVHLIDQPPIKSIHPSIHDRLMSPTTYSTAVDSITISYHQCPSFHGGLMQPQQQSTSKQIINRSMMTWLVSPHSESKSTSSPPSHNLHPSIPYNRLMTPQQASNRQHHLPSILPSIQWPIGGTAAVYVPHQSSISLHPSTIRLRHHAKSTTLTINLLRPRLS